MRLKMMLAGLALAFAPVMAAAETPIDGTDPALLEPQLREMGYAPDKFDVNGETATTILHFPSETLALVLGGCTGGKKCTYAILVGHFTDLKTAPADWIAKMNANYDVIKVWLADDGKVTYSSGSIITGMQRSTLKAWIDIVIASSDDLGAEAIKAGFGAKK
jgi:hypothetical protein